MATRPSPTVRGRRLRRELVAMREVSTLTLQQVSAQSEGGFNASTLGRWETGERVPRLGDLRILLDIYQVTGDRREQLVQLARQAREKGWWHPHRDMLKAGFGIYIGLEAEASVIHSYHAQLIPGLLQTPDYTRAVIRAIRMNENLDGIEEQVQLRKNRQELLNGPTAVQLSVVLDEAALRRHIGDPHVMRNQLQHLTTVAGLPNVTIRVLPFSAGPHAALDGTFYVLEFPELGDPAVVYLEQAASSLALEHDDEVRRYARMFGDLAARALTPERTGLFIEKIADEQR